VIDDAPSLLSWLDEACEQPVELLPLDLGELSEELRGVGVDRLLGPRLRPPSRRRESDHIRTSVVGVPFALPVAGPLEIVDQGHHRGAVDPQPFSNRLLGQSDVSAVKSGSC
jgi:hypothetical protein